MLQCHFSWRAQFGDFGISLFVAGTTFGDVGLSLFVPDEAFGDVGVSLLSLFVAGATFCEIWVDSRSEKGCNFQCKMRFRSAKSNLRERAGAR